MIFLQKVFGVSVNKKQHDGKIKQLLKDNDALGAENLNLKFEISKLKKDNGKVCLQCIINKSSCFVL